MCNVIIIGGGGHAKVVADIVIKSGDILLGFLDDCKRGTVLDGYSVIGKIMDAEKFSKDAKFIVAIGNNEVRRTLMEQPGLRWYTAVHPSAQLGTGVQIGEGSCVAANAVINASASVGKGCIINTSAVVEHDCVVGDFSHVSPSAVLCGTVKVGHCVHIGANATVINNLLVCDNSVIGAGAVVVKHITEQNTYVGVPARKLY